jgi:hypothetical protein
MLAVDAVSSLVVGATLLLVFRRFGVGRADSQTETEPALAG